MQIGPYPQGGAYTYDWIENLLGRHMHSVECVLSEFQHPAVGETIGFGSTVMRLELVEPEHALVWHSEDGIKRRAERLTRETDMEPVQAGAVNQES